MKTISLKSACGAALLVLLAGTVWAVPTLLNFQGRLTDDNSNPLTGSYAITLSLWDTGPGSGGTQLWTETQTAAVVNGIFGVTLGSVTAIPASVFADPNRWLEVQIGTNPAMTPRQRLVSSAYAVQAGTVDDGAITDAKLAASGLSLSRFTVGSIPTTQVDGLSTDLANRVLKAGDTISGNLQVGTVTASTLSAGGYLTLAELTSNPPLARGRVFYHGASNSLRVSLDGLTYVALSTGGSGGGVGGGSGVLADTGQFTGDGTAGNALTLLASSVTLQGNVFNGASQLVRLTGAGVLPTLDGAALLNLSPGSLGNGTLPPGVIASSVAVSAFYSAAVVRSGLGLAIGSDVQAYDVDLDDLADGSLTGSKVGAGVPAANIAAGTLGASVIASSVAVNAVYPAAVLAGTYSNITIPGANVSGNITGNAANITGSLPASQVAAGSLGSGVIASSIAVNAVRSANINDAEILFADMASNGCAANEIMKRNAGNTAWICAADNGAGGGAVSLAPATADADASANSSIFINDTGGGSLLRLQQGGADKWVVDNAGSLSAGGVPATRITAGNLGTDVVASSVAVNTVHSAGLQDAAVTDAKLAATGLDASKFTVGTLADARLSTNVNLLNANQTVSGVKTLTSSATFKATGGYSIAASSGISITTGVVSVGGGFALENTGPVFTLTVDNQLVNVGARSYIRMTSDSTLNTDRTFCLTAGSVVGHILILEWTSTNKAEMRDNPSNALNCAGAVETHISDNWPQNSTFAQDDMIQMIYNGSFWLEVARATN